MAKSHTCPNCGSRNLAPFTERRGEVRRLEDAWSQEFDGLYATNVTVVRCADCTGRAPSYCVGCGDSTAVAPAQPGSGRRTVTLCSDCTEIYAASMFYLSSDRLQATSALRASA